MPQLRNKPLADCADFEANIRHYQDLNNQIERKTCAVFESVSKLNSSNNTGNEGNKNKTLDETNVPVRSEPREKSAVTKHQIIIDLNQRLRDIQNELESTTHQQKKLEEERDNQRQELNHLKDNVKKMKSALHSKQLLHDAQKKEMATMTEKLKIEEQSRKSLQKEIERLSKQLATIITDKEKLAEKLEHSKTDLMLLKQHKIDEHPGNKVPIMLKCIRKQAFLIENLLKQISCLEQMKN